MLVASENFYGKILKDATAWQILKFLAGMSAYHLSFRGQRHLGTVARP